MNINLAFFTLLSVGRGATLSVGPRCYTIGRCAGVTAALVPIYYAFAALMPALTPALMKPAPTDRRVKNATNCWSMHRDKKYALALKSTQRQG